MDEKEFIRSFLKIFKVESAFRLRLNNYCKLTAYEFLEKDLKRKLRYRKEFFEKVYFHILKDYIKVMKLNIKLEERRQIYKHLRLLLEVLNLLNIPPFMLVKRSAKLKTADRKKRLRKSRGILLVQKSLSL